MEELVIQVCAHGAGAFCDMLAQLRIAAEEQSIHDKADRSYHQRYKDEDEEEGPAVHCGGQELSAHCWCIGGSLVLQLTSLLAIASQGLDLMRFKVGSVRVYSCIKADKAAEVAECQDYPLNFRSVRAHHRDIYSRDHDSVSTGASRPTLLQTLNFTFVHS